LLGRNGFGIDQRNGGIDKNIIGTKRKDRSEKKPKHGLTGERGY
jgi:hypothetical protein